MKRLVTFIAALLCICAIAFASTSLATIGAVIPLSLYSGELESQTIDISDYDVPVQIAIPIILADSSLELTDILSSDPQTLLWALVEASSLFATVEDLWTVAGSGQVTISPSLEKLGEGTISCTIDYDDVLVMYQSAGVTDIGSIDGSATLSLDFMTDGLATLTVEADTSLAPASVITLTVRLDESALSSYMKLRGMDIEMVRYMLLAMLLRFTLKPLVGERRARLLALLVVSLYVFLIGPRPSIIRSWLLSAVFLLFRGIRSHDALMATFVLQGLLFPEGLTTLASTYSYLSLVGIMSLSSFLKESLDNLVLLPSFIATNMTASLAALLFTCPLSYLVFGEYQLSVILTGGLASVLVYIYMVLSLASLAVPLPSLLSLVYKACGAVMDFGASFPMCTSPWGYIVLLLISLSGIMLSAILNAKRRTPCGLSTTQASRRSLRSLASRLLR